MDTEATLTNLFNQQCDILQVQPSETSTCEARESCESCEPCEPCEFSTNTFTDAAKLRIPATVSSVTINKVLSEHATVTPSTASTYLSTALLAFDNVFIYFIYHCIRHVLVSVHIITYKLTIIHYFILYYTYISSL